MIVLIIIGCLIAAFLLYILFLFICSLFIDTSREYETDSKFYRALLVGATRILMLVTNLKVTIEGKEKIPEGRFMMVCNHRSKYDPMISWVVLKKYHIAFISKPENFAIPIFGRFIRKCAFMAINRENPREGVKTIEKAARLMKEDVVSVGIYPEGTRATTPDLLPLRNGCFKIAQMANVPIVVIAMTGTQKIHVQSPWKRVHVQMVVTDVISAEEVMQLRTKEIGERVTADFKEILNKEIY